MPSLITVLRVLSDVIRVNYDFQFLLTPFRRDKILVLGSMDLDGSGLQKVKRHIVAPLIRKAFLLEGLSKFRLVMVLLMGKLLKKSAHFVQLYIIMRKTTMYFT